MKKLLTPIFAFITTTSVFYSCSLLKSLDEVKKSGFNCSNYSYVPVNEMDKNEVLAMIRNYYNKQYSAINQGNLVFNDHVSGLNIMDVDSRAVYFNLDTIKKLIYYVEKAAENFSAVEKKNLGLNIYFASYPDEIHKQKRGYDYTNRHTLIFIPTIFNSEYGIAQDFDLRNSLNGTNVTKPLYFSKSFLSDPSVLRLAVMGAGRDVNNMMSQNDGTAMPPPPNSDLNSLLQMTQ